MSRENLKGGGGSSPATTAIFAILSNNHVMLFGEFRYFLMEYFLFISFLIDGFGSSCTRKETTHEYAKFLPFLHEPFKQIY